MRLEVLPVPGLPMIESGDDLVCIDCGVTFPQEPTLGPISMPSMASL